MTRDKLELLANLGAESAKRPTVKSDSCRRHRQRRAPHLTVAPTVKTWTGAKLIVSELVPQNLELGGEATAVEFYHTIRKATLPKLIWVLGDAHIE